MFCPCEKVAYPAPRYPVTATVADRPSSVLQSCRLLNRVVSDVSGADMKKCNASVTTNLGQDVRSSLEPAPAMFVASETANVQRRRVLMKAITVAPGQLLSRRLAEDRCNVVLKRQFEASRRAPRGTLPRQVESSRVTMKDEVHTVGTRLGVCYPWRAYFFDPGAVGVETRNTATKRLQGWSANLDQFRHTVHDIAGKRNCWADVFVGVSEPLCESNRPNTLKTATKSLKMAQVISRGRPQLESIKGKQ